MTYEEMKAEAEAAIKGLVSGRQRSWVVRDEELRTLLITAYCKGHKAGVDKSVAAFSPYRLVEYQKLTG